MLIRLFLDVSHDDRRTRVERAVEWPAVPRTGDWVDVTGSGAAQVVERVVFSPFTERIDVVLEPVSVSRDQAGELLHLLLSSGWDELRPASRW